jgi:surfeit locus 1 family protein
LRVVSAGAIRRNRGEVYPLERAVVDRRWHAPRPFAVLLTLFGLAAFGALGFWQIDRAAQKERLFAAFADAGSQTPMTLDEARRAQNPLRYPLVGVRGRYDAEHSYVLDDQTRDGKVGGVAFAIFEPADGSAPILVDRGFVARNERGAKAVIPPLPDGEQQLLALYAPPPGSGLRLGGNALPRQQSWPKQSIYIDVGEIGEDADRRLDAKILRLAPEQGSGFVREWRPNVFPPERHRAYAFTWFTLAAVVVGVFIGMHWRKDTST